MTASAAPFLFVDDPTVYHDAQALIVRVPLAARGKRKLLGVLSRGLRFPHYFGHNWDALEECLRDLAWLESAPRVVIVHEGLPFSPTGENLAIYLSILRNAASTRKQSSRAPLLEAAFASSVRGMIQSTRTT